MKPPSFLVAFFILDTSQAQNFLDGVKGGGHDIKKDLAALFEYEEKSDTPLWLRPVSDQCQENYDLFKEHWTDPLLFMGYNKSQLWASKSKYVKLYSPIWTF